MQSGIFELNEMPEDMPDFLLEIEEKHHEIEQALLQLEGDPNDKELLNQLFRALHTVKGDARIVNLDPMVDFAHVVESIIEFIREGTFKFDPLLSEIILLSADRILQMTREAASTGKCKVGDLHPIRQEMELLILNGPSKIQQFSPRVIGMLKGKSANELGAVPNESGVFVLKEGFDDLIDFLDEVEEKHAVVEQALLNLEYEPDNQELLNEVFRALHTVKGDARIFGIGPMVDFTHSVENIVQGLREKTFKYNSELSEIILLCVDRIRVITRDVHSTYQSDLSDLPSIIELLDNMVEAGPHKLSETSPDVLAALSGDRPRVSPKKKKIKPTHVEVPRINHFYDDLDFFRQLANQVDEDIPNWEGRTSFIASMAIGMNGVAGNIVNYFQLEAGVYLHDIGMGFLPRSLIEKQSKLDDDEFARLKEHPLIGAGVINRLNGWQEAADIVRQHHEHFDGKGYPDRLRKDEITDGARIIAICDAFYAMTHQRAYKVNRRSIVRAVAEINACAGTQFCPFWVEQFNKVIKIQHLAGAFKSLE